ncbi:MAG: mechanosensitive ion channel family protein [Flavobacteriales bacterium]
MNLNTDKYQHWLDKGLDHLVAYIPGLLLALLVLWGGMRLIKLFGRAVEKGMANRDVEPTLRRFVGSLVSVGLKILLFVTAIQMMGVQTTSFVAIIGAAGLAVGLALQGTLANFAGGVLVLLFKPYKVGDLIEAQGVVGHVKEIQIFTTVMLSPENKTVIVPNGAAANGIITNYTAQGRIRVDCVLAIERGTDVTRAREALMKAMLADPKVMRDPAPSVTMSKQLPEGVELAVRPYCDPIHYWDVYFGTLENGAQALSDAGIKPPTSEHKIYMQNA